jgi:hypothetical protein
MTTFPKFDIKSLLILNKEYEKERLKRDLTTFIIKTYGTKRYSPKDISSLSEKKIDKKDEKKEDENLYSIFQLTSFDDEKEGYIRDSQVLEEIIKELQSAGYKARRMFGDTSIEFWGSDLEDSLNAEILKSVKQ